MTNKEVKKIIATGALIIYVIFILWATVFSRVPGSHSGIMLLPFSAWGITKAYHQHFIANFFMLIPVGFLLPHVYAGCKSLKKTIVVCLVFSLILETIQLITGTGDFQIDDLWCNTVSGLIGYCLMLLTDRIL